MGITVTQLLKFMRKHKAQKHDIDAVVYWKTEFNKREGKKEIESTQPHLPLGDVISCPLCDSSNIDLEENFCNNCSEYLY